MGRRSRRRGTGPVAPQAPSVAPAPPAPGAAAGRSRRARPERPKAPWHPVPLTELATLGGIVLLVIGFFDYQERKWLLVAGMALASLGGLDTALREHFTGYRSHTTVLAAFPAVILAGVLYFASAPWLVLVVAAAAVFAAALWALRRHWAAARARAAARRT